MGIIYPLTLPCGSSYETVHQWVHPELRAPSWLSPIEFLPMHLFSSWLTNHYLGKLGHSPAKNCQITQWPAIYGLMASPRDHTHRCSRVIPNGKLVHWLLLYWMYHPPSSPNDLLQIHLNPLSSRPKRPNQLTMLSRHIRPPGLLKHQVPTLSQHYCMSWKWHPPFLFSLPLHWFTALSTKQYQHWYYSLFQNVSSS
jgi:hypothetical protein